MAKLFVCHEWAIWVHLENWIWKLESLYNNVHFYNNLYLRNVIRFKKRKWTLSPLRGPHRWPQGRRLTRTQSKKEWNPYCPFCQSVHGIDVWYCVRVCKICWSAIRLRIELRLLYYLCITTNLRAHDSDGKRVWDVPWLLQEMALKSRTY